MKTSKRILALLLTLVMLLGMFPVTAAAESSELVLKADSVTALLGSQVDVNITAESNPGISGLQFLLEYDSSILTLTGVDYA